MVVEAGEGADGPSSVKQVCALVAGGGYAEYCVAPAGTCLPVPEGAVADRSGGDAGNPVHRLGEPVRARLSRPRATIVLVHGGTSGIGTMAIALGQLFGLKVIVTCGSDEKCSQRAEARRCGRDQLSDAGFRRRGEEAQRRAQGVSVVLDMVGGDYVPRNLACLVGRRTSCLHRLSARSKGGGPDPGPHAPAADPDRLDAAAPHRSNSRRWSPTRSLRTVWPYVRGRPAEACHRCRLSARSGGGRRTPGWKRASMSGRSFWRSVS